MEFTKEKRDKLQNKYKIEFVDRILDPVHGFIDLTQVEQKIIELPIFKRMQSLKQLSLTNWVFPGAEHTRYMHSLGVMHIVDLMASNLKDENYRAVFTDGQRQILRLAGLLHDIGHYPLSHVTEYVYLHNLFENDDKLLDHNERVKKEIDKLNSDQSQPIDYMKSRYSKPMHHETIGTLVIENDPDIKRIIEECCPFIDIHDIQDIIVGCVDRNPAISAMVQLIHSELDADGIDYVMRDATFSGTSYGGFELGLLLRNLVVKQYNGIDIVGIRPKGISVVDQYLISKYFAYTQVIFNRHVAIFDKMAEMLSAELIKLDKSTYPTSNTLVRHIERHTQNDEYLRFTDRAFWTQIDTFDESDLQGYVADYIVAAHKRLSHYQEFETVPDGEVIYTSNNKKKAYEVLSSSGVYSRLTSENEDRLMLFHCRGFTTEVTENEYRAMLSMASKEKGTEVSEDRFIKENVARLQEGIPIIDKENPLRLLVDDPRSVMNHLHGTCTYILREYNVC
ncbi:HD domain-containing protein [Candidatus Avoscillospira sp. LCP25S3_F1]|uniref:HD domain-containing protein n=1 Tax=Candidatus Avoscillospira sp. LCP25S3_F1 TaxID=3438825 RepID=UPI003F8EAD5E